MLNGYKLSAAVSSGAMPTKLARADALCSWGQDVKATCGFGVKLVQRLDRKQLVLALVGHDPINFTPHHNVHAFSNVVFPVPAAIAMSDIPFALSRETMTQPCAHVPIFLQMHMHAQATMTQSKKPC